MSAKRICVRRKDRELVSGKRWLLQNTYPTSIHPSIHALLYPSTHLSSVLPFEGN